MVTCALRDKAVVLRPEDDAAVAKAEICAGTLLEDGGGVIEASQDVRPGHKIARRHIAVGQPLRRYGQVIGFATCAIAKGDHVHTHNLAIGELQREYEVGTDVRPVDYYPPSEMRSFEGYRREERGGGTPPHRGGCGTKLFGEDHLALQRVLAGYAKHPNVAAYLLIGLGCEVNQAVVMVERQRRGGPRHPGRRAAR